MSDALLPGSRGRTCSASSALSSRTRSLSPRDGAAPAVHPLVGIGGDRRVGRAQAAQEGRQDVVRVPGVARGEAEQVGVDDPVGEAVGHLVAPVHGQRGLADAGLAGDHDHARPTGLGLGPGRVERGALGLASGEGRRGDRRLPRHHRQRYDGRRAWPAPAGVELVASGAQRPRRLRRHGQARAAGGRGRRSAAGWCRRGRRRACSARSRAVARARRP
ncbi:hypothetical protein [Nocardioides convexus]|uniref:hypothetical protein n=1 Tax=Nocardioides convexus TaxID=2712224 RepID=UPI0024184F49|nr:hypothetical protein [Nocardioides convexus]